MRYRVTGPTSVYRTEPGETFETEMSEAKEARLTRAGHITRVEICEVCGFEAKSEQGLAAHRRTHEQEND